MGTKWDTTDRKMVLLSFLAYNGFWSKDPNKVAHDVKEIVTLMAPGQKMYWGPAVHQPDKTGSDKSDVTDALMFMTKTRGDDEYTIVIRGTNPFSATEWITQNFMVRRLTSWSGVSPFAQGDSGMISEGTANAVDIHSNLVPEADFECAGKFLLETIVDICTQAKNKVALNFTGHSLGGLLAPTMALWVFDQLHQSAYKSLLSKANFFVYGFAGPTAGNGEFLAYNRTSLPNIKAYQNAHDLPVLAWNEDTMKTMENLYTPIKMGEILTEAYKICEKSIASKDYQQFPEPENIPSSVVPDLLYIVEVGYQHTVPYLNILDPVSAKKIQSEILTPLKAMTK